MLPLCAALPGFLLFRSPLIDIRSEDSCPLPKCPEFRRASVYGDVIVDGEILPIDARESKIVPFVAMLDMLAVLHILAAVIQSVLEGEPGNMILLYVELDLKLPDP